MDKEFLSSYQTAMSTEVTTDHVADRLSALYGRAFGGKSGGRYRIPEKLVRQIWGRKRLYEDDIRDLGRAMLERGHVLIDMDSFLVVMAANSFVNYRRVNEDAVK